MHKSKVETNTSNTPILVSIKPEKFRVNGDLSKSQACAIAKFLSENKTVEKLSDDMWDHSIAKNFLISYGFAYIANNGINKMPGYENLTFKSVYSAIGPKFWTRETINTALGICGTVLGIIGTLGALNIL